MREPKYSECYTRHKGGALFCPGNGNPLTCTEICCNRCITDCLKVECPGCCVEDTNILKPGTKFKPVKDTDENRLIREMVVNQIDKKDRQRKYDEAAKDLEIGCWHIKKLEEERGLVIWSNKTKIVQITLYPSGHFKIEMED